MLRVLHLPRKMRRRSSKCCTCHKYLHIYIFLFIFFVYLFIFVFLQLYIYIFNTNLCFHISMCINRCIYISRKEIEIYIYIRLFCVQTSNLCTGMQHVFTAKSLHALFQAMFYFVETDATDIAHVEGLLTVT